MTKLTIATIGHMPAEFDKQKISNWKSGLFSVVGDIESYSLTEDSDGTDWEYTDSKLEKVLPSNFDGELLIAIINVPIEQNYYSRRLSDNRIVFTFHEVGEILNYSNIPLENVIYRLLYAYTLVYRRNNKKIPINDEITNFTHDETRGCLFDMNGIKTDIVYSCHQPILCPDCIERSKREKLSNEIISKTKTEIKRIKKPLYYRMVDFVKGHPIWSLLISIISAIALGAIGSFIATIFYEYIGVLP